MVSHRLRHARCVDAVGSAVLALEPASQKLVASDRVAATAADDEIKNPVPLRHPRVVLSHQGQLHTEQQTDLNAHCFRRSTVHSRQCMRLGLN